MSLDELRICIIGTLATGTQSELTRTLTDAGATVLSRLNPSADVVIAGAHAGSLLARTRTLGLPIVGEDDALGWLSGAPVDLTRTREVSPTRDLIGEARAALDGPPSSEAWSRVVSVLESCADQDIERVVDYLEPQLDRWTSNPDQHWTPDPGEAWLEGATRAWYDAIPTGTLRVAPHSWVVELLRGEASPKHRLIHAVHTQGMRANGTLLSRLVASENMENLQHLDLGESRTSATFWRKLRGAPSARALTHLRVEQLDASCGDGLSGEHVVDELRSLTLAHSERMDFYALRNLLTSELTRGIQELYVERFVHRSFAELIARPDALPSLRRWIVHGINAYETRLIFQSPRSPHLDEVGVREHLGSLDYGWRLPGSLFSGYLTSLTADAECCAPTLDLSGITLAPLRDDDPERGLENTLRLGFMHWDPPPGAQVIRLGGLWTEDVAEFLLAKGVEVVR